MEDAGPTLMTIRCFTMGTELPSFRGSRLIMLLLSSLGQAGREMRSVKRVASHKAYREKGGGLRELENLVL
jgi:hypothetical protein